ncbi:Membrane associated serine protease, rhomboid family [Neorhodopirellula lusitana]|uniref:Membrane associated serine protease, rhomboid family n=1 Tax=Neorhodopirellula lusitana TaxID=445327 RepID=A0ABY1Q6D0_9BACT|nr:rhomboid family intramembrane serine protease [Neorhodopirellula lusitana]SMP61169.1 Membrane associated serine protease, rhomboid family [Neorhodopirellula lusitana]
MGLYDRDYGRPERTPWDRIENPRSMLITLIVVNVAIFIAQLLFTYTVTAPLSPEVEAMQMTEVERNALLGASSQKHSYLDDYLAVRGSSLIRPWLWYQTLTYGFLHNIDNILHLGFNMFMLYVFGRPVEQRFGGQEFLKAYLAAIIFGGIVAMVFPWLYYLIAGDPSMLGGITLGASGAVTAVMIMFACLYPNQEILLMFVLPVKAWVVAVGIVIMNLLGAAGLSGSTTAYEVHLAGAAFGYFYIKQGWSFERIDLSSLADIPGTIRTRSRRAKLKLHDPEKKIREEAQEADRILAKIHESGESSLTSKERKTLERYSRRQRENRNN